MESNEAVSAVAGVIYFTFFTSVTIHTMMQVICKVASAPDERWPGKSHVANSVEFYKIEFLQYLYMGFFNELVEVPPEYDKCMFPDKTPYKDCTSDGYMVAQFTVKVKNADEQIETIRTRLQLTHIAKYLHHHQFLTQKGDTNIFQIYPGIPRDAIDLSHLCHNSQCCNPNHLCWEPSYINHHRNSCRFDIFELKTEPSEACHAHRLADSYNIRLPDCKLHLTKCEQKHLYPIVKQQQWPTRVQKTHQIFCQEELRLNNVTTKTVNKVGLIKVKCKTCENNRSTRVLERRRPRRLEYYREWKKNNPEKVKYYNQKHNKAKTNASHSWLNQTEYA